MKVGIVSAKMNKDVLDFFNQKFPTFFIPLSEIKFGVERSFSIQHKKLNLFDLDYLIINSNSSTLNREIFYTLLKMIEKNVNTPISSENFLIVSNKVLFSNILIKNNINVRKMFVIAQKAVIEDILKEISFPLIVSLPSKKRIVVTKRSTLLEVLSLFKPGIMITIEKILRNARNLSVFVVGNSVIGMEKIDDKIKIVKVEDKIKETAIKIKDLFSIDFCTIDFQVTEDKFYVDDIKISYSEDLLKKTNKNLELLANFIENKIKEREKSIFKKIERIMLKLLKVVKSEISYPWTKKKRL